MTVESKLDALITATGQIVAAQAANQTALLTAIQAITPGGSQAITDELAKIEGIAQGIQDTIGTEAPIPTPAPTPAP